MKGFKTLEDAIHRQPSLGTSAMCGLLRNGTDRAQPLPGLRMANKKYQFPLSAMAINKWLIQRNTGCDDSHGDEMQLDAHDALVFH